MYASHPDHMAAGEATLCAVYPDARNPFAHPELLEEGYEAWTVPEVWIMASGAGDTFIDITASIDRKVKALLCHVSQMTNPDAMDQTDPRLGVGQRGGRRPTRRPLRRGVPTDPHRVVQLRRPGV